MESETTSTVWTHEELAYSKSNDYDFQKAGSRTRKHPRKTVGDDRPQQVSRRGLCDIKAQNLNAGILIHHHHYSMVEEKPLKVVILEVPESIADTDVKKVLF